MDTPAPALHTASQTAREVPAVVGLRRRVRAEPTASAPKAAQPEQAPPKDGVDGVDTVEVADDAYVSIPGAFEPKPQTEHERKRLSAVGLLPDYGLPKTAWTDAARMLHMAKARVLGPREPEANPHDRVMRAVAAIAAAHAALAQDIRDTQKLRADAKKQLPWFMRRLGSQMGRIILPVAVSVTVVFVVLALPYVALMVGGLAGAITWFALRDQDPSPYRPVPQAPPARLKRPKLELAALDNKLRVYNRAESLVQRLVRAEKTEALPDALGQVLATYEAAAAKATTRVKALKRTAGSGLWTEPLAHWGTTLAVVYVVDQVNQLMDLPLGPLWRGLCASLSQPVMGLASLYYGRQVARNTFASADAEHRIKADLLYVLEGEREALAQAAIVLRQAILRVEGTPTLPQAARSILTKVFAPKKF